MVVAYALPGTLQRRDAVDRLLMGCLVACIAIGLVNVLRGLSIVDSVNALRVLMRYPMLALVLLRAARHDPGVNLWVRRAIVLAVALQLGIGVVEIASAVANVLPNGTIADLPGSLLAVGTTGRYDRFGLIIAALAPLVLVGAVERGRIVSGVLLVASWIILYWSTSRQAMLAMVAGLVVLAFLPRVRPSIRGVAIVGCVLGLLMALTTSAAVAVGGIPVGGDGAPGSGTPQVIAKGSTELSLNPNRNFRLYLDFALTPWVLAQEPILGFGPGLHDDVVTDPRLQARLESDGMPWSYARYFMNDSNYASMLIQFGLVASAAFIAMLLGAVAVIARHAWTDTDPLLRFALAFSIGTLVAAAFGPAFEIRPTSATMWLAIAVAFGSRASGIGSIESRARPTAS